MRTPSGQRWKHMWMTHADVAQMYLGRFCPLGEAAVGTSWCSERIASRHPAGIAISGRTQKGRVRCDMEDPSDCAVLVHFPHPGTEHNPKRMSRQSWNTRKEHGRKFLCSLGQYVDDATRSPVEASLAFWGEWEAPSYVRQCWPREGELPQFLQEPVWEHPTFNGFRQNTDPWVFGDCFRYSNCKPTIRSPTRAPSALVVGRQPNALQALPADRSYYSAQSWQKSSNSFWTR
jgi:hypothetical protein